MSRITATGAAASSKHVTKKNGATHCLNLMSGKRSTITFIIIK